MLQLKGYIEIEYTKMQQALYNQYLKSGQTLMEIAVRVQLRSITSICNALGKSRQPVSDAMLSIVMKGLDFPGVIVYDEGVKRCFIKESFVKKNEISI